MQDFVEELELEVGELPDLSTVCARFQQLEMRVWRVLLRLSTDFHDLGEYQAIDAPFIERISAIQHFAKRTDYTFEDVKTTAFVDCSTGALLDIHCSMKQHHDTRIGWQVLHRNKKSEHCHRRQRLRLGLTSPKTPGRGHRYRD